MLKAIISFITVYCIFVAIIFIIQRSLLYLPSKSHPNPADWQVADMREVTLKTSDGLSILAWYKPAQKNKPTIIYFHGNAFHLGGRGPLVRPYLDAGFGVLLLSYRGYAGNPGRPSEQGLYRDGRAAIEFVKSQHVPENHMVLYGESLGTGIAVQMATEFPVGAMILLAPYSSMAEVGQYHYFYLPAKWLILDRFDSLAKIKNIHAPLLLIHSEDDEIVPFKFAKKLFDAANPPKEIILLKNLGHNDYHEQSAVVIPFLLKYIK